MFRASLCPSSGAYQLQQQQPLVYRRNVVVAGLLAVVGRVPGDFNNFKLLKAGLNPICYLLTLLAHHFLHVRRIRVKSLTLRLIMSYICIYMEHLFLMFLDHTQRRSTACRRSPAEIVGSNPTGGMDIFLL